MENLLENNNLYVQELSVEEMEMIFGAWDIYYVKSICRGLSVSMAIAQTHYNIGVFNETAAAFTSLGCESVLSN
jgi:hypothetical protein